MAAPLSPGAALAAEIHVEVAGLDPSVAQRAVLETLKAEGLSIDDAGPLAMATRIRQDAWVYTQGLLQVEVVVAWEIRGGPEGDMKYQGETRGLQTQAAPRRALARRHRRAETLGELPQSEGMREEAIRSATRSLVGRKNFRSVVQASTLPPDSEGNTMNTFVDFSDRALLGKQAPAALREPVARSGARRRTTGIVVTMAGLLTTLGAVGTYSVSAHVPRNRLNTLRVLEVSGWGMMASGGVLWFHGDRRARSW